MLVLFVCTAHTRAHVHTTTPHRPQHTKKPKIKLGERGVGGSKCGATAVNALIYADGAGGSALLTSNVGDARILLVRGGEAVELTEEHVPDK